MKKRQLKIFHDYQLKDFQKIPLFEDMIKSIDEFSDWFNKNIDSLSREELFIVAMGMQPVVRELEKMKLRYQREAGKILNEIDRGKNGERKTERASKMDIG